ncbi:Ctf8-domain-containing protein [Podospora didyma]|uniref:Ctf8-domain-containing protein n=1 Tax=Podospora didyma TaxID=330526 RepID=A0AAE0NT19_9PEZI|nr:Ctf8-domain-containing protein [Podospora didyma]
MEPSSVKLYPKSAPSSSSSDATPPRNPLPTLLQTPTGLALLELQGTINVPGGHADDNLPVDEAVPIGRLEFPDYRPDAVTFDPKSTAWMKRVYMNVGQHQRLMGEVKKLPKPVAVVRRRKGEEEGEEEGGDGEGADLEVVEIVRYKIVFSQRPEPVTKT